MYQLLPNSLYNVPAIESWLGDMARKGWRCTGLGGTWYGVRGAWFEKAAPEEVRYRLEPQLEKRPAEPDAETRDFYADMGWEYVASTMLNEFYLWRSTRPDARELHTDPGTEGLAFGWVSRQHGYKLALLAFLDLIFLWMQGRLGWVESWTQQYGMSLLPLYGLVLVWLDVQCLLDFLALWKLRRVMAAGFPMGHTAPYGGQRRTWRIYFAVAAALLVLILGNNALSIPETLESIPPEVSIVTLEQLGGSTHSERAEHWSNLAVTDAWLISQDADVGPTYYGTYVQLCDLRWDFLAGQLLRDRAKGWEGDGKMEVLEDRRFDEARWCRDRYNRQVLLARKGGRVLEFHAKAPEDLRDHLDEFAGMFP